MKAKQLATLLLTLILAIGCLSVGVTAATIVTAGTTGSITIENALEHDTLAAYKVIDITYNAGSNTLTHAWNSAFAEYFAGTTEFNNTAYTVKEFAALEGNPEALKNLLANLPKYIANKGITPVQTATVAAGSTTATFAGLDMGEYFIRPTSTTSVYQLMLQKIEPTVSNGKYVIDDVTFAAKHTQVTVAKTADKTSVTKKEKVTYTITVDIPTYAAQAVDKSFSVADLLPDGLTIVPDSICVKRNETDITDQAGDQADDQYALDTTATNDYTFKLSVSKDQYANNSWANYGGQKLVITYTATLNDNNTTAVNATETNTATLDYSNYPYVENSHKQKTASVDVTTFAIKIDKYDNGDTGIKLANAKFDLYRTATQAEIDAGTFVIIPHTEVKGIKLESVVTGDNGTATFEKYEANGNKYTYYLVETQAPSGYNLLDNAVQVNFTDTDVEETAGVYTVKVPNSSGIQLPITGGTGTILFTVIGIALMAGAVVLLVISRKKSKATEGK